MYYLFKQYELHSQTVSYKLECIYTPEMSLKTTNSQG